jgi:hypothetical protein
MVNVVVLIEVLFTRAPMPRRPISRGHDHDWNATYKRVLFPSQEEWSQDIYSVGSEYGIE